MHVHPGPGPSTTRPHPAAIRRARLIGGAALIGVLAAACATTTPGRAAPAAGATVGGTPGQSDDATAAGSTATGPTTTGRTSPAAPTTTATTATTTRSSAAAAPTGRSVPTATSVAAPATPSDTPRASAPTPAAWSVVPPAGLQAWESVPADDVSSIWRSGNCMVVVSAPADVPAMTDERFARAHVRYATNAFTAEVDPTITETGEVLSQKTDPLRVSDPTRLEPPAVHLQLSGFRYEFPTIGVTDQTYSFVTQGGGQGLVVSTVCTDDDFASRYATEIAPLLGDLGVDTGI